MHFSKLLELQSWQDGIAEGFKLSGHDSSYAIIDSKHHSIFAFSTERITRQKHSEGSSLQFFNIKKLGSDKFIIHDSFLHTKDFLVRFFNNSFFERFHSEKIRKIIYGTLVWSLRYSWLKRLSLVFFKEPLFFLEIIYQRFFFPFSSKINQHVEWHKHHLCHALPAYFFSPFYLSNCIVFVLDWRGEDEYSSLWLSDQDNLKLISESRIEYFSQEDHCSIGLLYSIFTLALGFTPNSDEGKTEALAAYGVADMDLYNLCNSCYIVDHNKLLWSHNVLLVQNLHNIRFLKNEIIRIGKENFAATIQKFLEDTVVELLNAVYDKYHIDCLCLSWGTVANVIMNLHIYERTPFKKIYIFPAMADDGTAFGPAIIQSVRNKDDLSWLNKEIMPYWGPSYTRWEVLEELHRWSDKISWNDVNDRWPEIAAQSVFSGGIIAIFQGKMEFGPRALGNRSIIADPRDKKIREKMNLSIKRRPYFQPFCPSILESERERLFENSYPNKHMTMAFRFKENIREILPSACHIDGTARPQFVEESDNPNYFRLLSEIKRLTGYGVVVNTSFNLHGRAMVMSPDQAIRDFLDCNLDALFIEWFFVKRI